MSVWIQNLSTEDDLGRGIVFHSRKSRKLLMVRENFLKVLHVNTCLNTSLCELAQKIKLYFG